ncbi:MAG: 2-oxoacid:acceptor oxidoreductase family protein [Gammaproteobacteria bacterium]|nr:2-oxoacid:acceptor oxidoreductase family protein [Gammaproteobacteria bacterium]MBU1655828.1 2-oxoacid:acceptor oxidoreductase family protein [Gammaproteobacteria bacterium]MBU1961728.1 2-oxoacid:acceptor oxidoreductase family protein [Gammaproteobacteria bacterium]
MYRIRFHGRGGQGMKTAGRILGTAFFLEGYEVQDAPRYGAERRGLSDTASMRGSRDAGASQDAFPRRSVGTINSAIVGVRFYFGESKSLKQRHREDDPVNPLFNSLMGAANGL